MKNLTKTYLRGIISFMNQTTIARPDYLKLMNSWRDKQIIKVITGVRRSGKSTLLDLLSQQLLQEGVPISNIIRLDMEDLALSHLTSAQQLHTFVTSRLRGSGPHYLLIDEVQMINEWQKAIISLFLRPHLDIYLTGSNAYLLSGELATLIAGRFVHLEVLPLSFREFMSVPEIDTDVTGSYIRYITDGGFPFVMRLDTRRNIRDYLQDLYNTIIIKDIVSRQQIRDVPALERVAMYLFDNIANLTSIKKIADTMTADGQKISVTSIDRYISGLLEAYIFYRADRYDLKGKQYLKTGAKYYASDLGWRFHLRGSKLDDEGRILENIVYLELRRRGYQVFVGKCDDAEIDFVARDGNNQIYIQVCQTTHDPATLKHEIAPLQAVPDNYPRFLLTLDRQPNFNFAGIRQVNVLDWLQFDQNFPL